jgi:hypothetical protein
MFFLSKSKSKSKSSLVKSATSLYDSFDSSGLL